MRDFGGRSSCSVRKSCSIPASEGATVDMIPPRGGAGLGRSGRKLRCDPGNRAKKAKWPSTISPQVRRSQLYAVKGSFWRTSYVCHCQAGCDGNHTRKIERSSNRVIGILTAHSVESGPDVYDP